MKKNIVRVLAFVLVLILAMGVIPLGALAANIKVDVHAEVFDKHPTGKEFNSGDGYAGGFPYGYKEGSSPITIKTSDYESLIQNYYTGEKYDLKGIIDFPNAKYNESLPVAI